MKISDAIRKSMKEYYKGATFDNLKKTKDGKKMKYTKKFFDSVGENHGVKPYEVE